MALGAEAFKPAIVVAIFAMIVLSSLGHPKTGPLCSDCASRCSTNCTEVVAANCSSFCNPPPGCDDCKTQVLQGCQNCCSNSTSSSDCCRSGCTGDCGTCNCDCNNLIISICRLACNPNYSGCQACSNAVGQQCNTSCNNACDDNCVKKEKEC